MVRRDGLRVEGREYHTGGPLGWLGLRALFLSLQILVRHFYRPISLIGNGVGHGRPCRWIRIGTVSFTLLLRALVRYTRCTIDGAVEQSAPFT